MAVRRIVKVAAETWRYARLEREMITATMAAAEHPDRFDDASGSGDLSSGTPPEVLLPMLPFIEREPAHEDLRSAANRNDAGCAFSRGVALSPDRPVILARLAELGDHKPEALPTQDTTTEESSTPQGPYDQTRRDPVPPLSPRIVPVANSEKQAEAENGVMGFDNEAVSTGRSKKASGTRAMEAADQMETQSAKEGATPRSSISGRQSPLTAKSSSGEVPKWGMARNDVEW